MRGGGGEGNPCRGGGVGLIEKAVLMVEMGEYGWYCGLLSLRYKRAFNPIMF